MSEIIKEENNIVIKPGKDIIASGDKIYWDMENEPKVGYELAVDAANVSISVYDDNGKLMRTFESSGTDEGMNYAVWDGRRESELGAVLPAGEYTFKIDAKNAGGKAIEAITVISGEVVGVNTEEGHSYLNVAGVKIPASDIIEVKQKGSLLNLVEGLGNTVKAVGGVATKIAPFLL